MTELDERAPSPLWRVAKVAGLTLLTALSAGAVFGFLGAHREAERAMSVTGWAILAGIVLLAAGSAWLLVRTLRSGRKGAEPLTRKERLNRNILVLCGVLGALIAILMMVAQEGRLIDSANIFSSAPLAPWVAIALIVMVGVIAPALSFIWHRSAVDEQEVDAYKTGALWGLNIFMIGAPVWWIAWRGGFVPAPDGIVIYFVTIAAVGLVWLWKKYR